MRSISINNKLWRNALMNEPYNPRIAIYADGANKEKMQTQYRDGLVKGFTTNPTLMAAAGITDYERFARGVLEVIPDLPISFEVFSDEFAEMGRQARMIAQWGANVNVKIPITNTRRESSLSLIEELLRDGVKLNVTAMFTPEQVDGLRASVGPLDDVIASIFAGRIADAGQDPEPIMRYAVEVFRDSPQTKVLWASSREAFNIVQAERCGCHIITVTDDILKKMKNFGKDLSEFSLDTVKMFYRDATTAGFKL